MIYIDNIRRLLKRSRYKATIYDKKPALPEKGTVINAVTPEEREKVDQASKPEKGYRRLEAEGMLR
jgi:hypothetical protein